MVIVATPRSNCQPNSRLQQLLQRDEQQQHRQAGDDLGHDQRRGSEALQQRASLERAEARQHEARERAERHGAGGAHRGDLDGQPCRGQDLAVAEQPAVPLERRRADRNSRPSPAASR